MNAIQVQIEGPTSVEPGDEIRGTVSWNLAEIPEVVYTRLFWYTEGRGDRDLSVVIEKTTRPSAASGKEQFELRVPSGPYSFSGQLISLIWGIEGVVEPGGQSDRVEIVVGPGGREARIVGTSG